MSKNSVIGIVLSPDKKQVLVIKRRDVPMWAFPGGGVDNNETPENAIAREIKEETGLQIEIIRKTAEYYPISRLASYTHVFECQHEGNEPGTSDETIASGFYPIDKLPEPFFHIHQLWLNDALRNEPEIIRKSISEATMRNLIKYFFIHPIHVIRFALSRLGLPINKS